MRKILIFSLVISLSSISFINMSCDSRRESDIRDFDSLVDAYRDSSAHFNSIEAYRENYYDFGEVIISKWNDCRQNGSVQAEAVAAIAADGHYLDGSVSECVASSLYDIVAQDPIQFEVLASILNLDKSDEFKHTALQLAELFFFFAVNEEIYKDGAKRQAEEYIHDIYKLYPTFNHFSEKAGMKIQVTDGSIYINGKELGSPANIIL